MQNHQAVVVGAGAAGLAATIELARAGVPVLLVERRATGSELPRATVLSLRSMELVRSWGLGEQVEALADQVEMTMLAMSSAARAAEGISIDVGYPNDLQSAVLSPTRPVCVAQDLLESVLIEHLSVLPHVTVARGCEVLDVATSESSVRVILRDSSGQSRLVEAEYVVGADGARSAVRRALDIQLRGPETLYAGTRVEFRAPLWPVLAAHRHLIYSITEPDATGVLLPAGRGDRWVFGATHGPEGDLTDPPTEPELFERVLRATGLARHEVRATRFDRFTSGAQVADRFSSDRVFLAGDAAHRVTPRGGTGLNLALADGHDLGWKLGWVLRGWADPTWLDTYEDERRPAILHNVRRSAEPVGARRPATSEIQVDLGGRVKHLWVSPGVSTLDLVTEGLTLVTAEPSTHCEAEARTHPGPPVSVVTLDPLQTRALGLGVSGAALLRPDGVPLATWSTAPRREQVTAAASALIAGDVHPAVAAAG